MDLSEIPGKPGVYLMKNARGTIIYVGKAKHLRRRVASYFSGSRCRGAKTEMLIRRIASVEVILTHTEQEALILEASLIKLHRPRYNINLKDDKRYPSLRLDTTHRYPNLTVVRKIRKDGARYFGPFSSSKAVRQTLQVINRAFRLRKCRSKNFHRRSRPCLNYQMNLCHAPCCFDVDPDDYRKVVKEVELFLRGRTPDLIRDLRREMHEAAAVEAFERAAVLRDKIFALEATLEKQRVVSTDFKDRDVLAVVEKGGMFVITLLSVRGGFLLGSRHFEITETLSGEPDLLGTFIRQYYREEGDLPGEILTSRPIDDTELTAGYLSGIRGEKVRIIAPRRGEKRALVNMALENARSRLENALAAADETAAVLERLKQRLKLARLPRRIECFDISNISGTHPVAGMAVFTDGRPDKGAYRKYIIRNVSRPDDYAAMAEVLRRRYAREGDDTPYPDLMMVDGGKGQLNIATAVIDSLGLSGRFDIVAIAKKDPARGEKDDRIFKPDRVNPVRFGKDRSALFLLQRIRDEVHRFSVSFHRRRRSKSAFASRLDAVRGVGEKRRKILLKHFGSLRKLRAATVEEMAALPGMNRTVAEAVAAELSRDTAPGKAGGLG